MPENILVICSVIPAGNVTPLNHSYRSVLWRRGWGGVGPPGLRAVGAGRDDGGRRAGGAGGRAAGVPVPPVRQVQAGWTQLSMHGS